MESQFERDKALEAGDDAEKVAALEEEIGALEGKLAEGRLGLGKLSNINKRNKKNNDQTTNKAGEEVCACASERDVQKISTIVWILSAFLCWKQGVNGRTSTK